MKSDSNRNHEEGYGIKRVKQVKNRDLVSKRRTQIMSAALELFLNKGFHATTIRDISGRSGVNQGSIYDYVKNKEDILQLLLNDLHRDRDEFPQDELEFLKRFDTLEGYLKDHIRYSWTTNRKGVLLTYRVTKSLKKEHLKNLLVKDSDLIDGVAGNIKRFPGITGDEKRINLVANIIVFLNGFVPMRDWNLKAYELEEILDLVVEMVSKILVDEN